MREGIFSLPARPRRATTLLYGLKPRGAGTGEVESLYSYLLSLAHSHRLAPNIVVGLVLPALGDLAVGLTPARWGWDKHEGQQMVGSGESAVRWSRALGAATGQSMLSFTTLQALAALVSGTDLVSKCERVCLHCLAEDQKSGELPYGRLLWRFEGVTCCPKHAVDLVSAECGKPKGAAATQFLRVKHAGVCSNCGSIGYRCMTPIHRAADAGSVWRAKQCQEIIADLAKIGHSAPGAMKAAVKAHCSERGGLTGFALRSGAPKSIISRWLNEPSARVSLAQLLDIAASEGLSLSALLQGSLLKLTEPCPVTEPHRVRRFLQPCDHEMIKVALTQAVAAGKTLTDVAKDLHVDLSTLAQHADLYASLRDAARLTAAEARAQRHAKAVQRAESAVLALLSTGKTPSMRNARAVTGEPWNPSELASVALTLLRIGIGENRLAYPFPASKVSEEFIARVDEAAQRIKVQMGITQAKLPLQYA